MTKPVIYHFNPTCELAIANDTFSYNPPELLQKMENDLAILPFMFAKKNDILISNSIPTDNFISEMNDYGFELPIFSAINQLDFLTEDSIKSIMPWGWSKAEHFLFQNVKNKCELSFRTSPVANWHDEYKSLFERSSSLKFLKNLLKNNTSDWFIESYKTGNIVTEIKEIEDKLNSECHFVLKSPLSSSGRGIQIVRNKKLSNSNLQWINGILRQQKYLIVEPYLDKLLDFSFQFKILHDGKVEYHGYSIFETNSNGQYKLSMIRPNLKTILKTNYTEVLEHKIADTVKILKKELENSEYPKYHRGYLGIDSLIFKSENRLLIQPCLEINCRMNMGILSKKLEEKVSINSFGKFELFFGKEKEYLQFVNDNKTRNPPQIKDGFIETGFISLTEPNLQNKFGAFLVLSLLR